MTCGKILNIVMQTNN